MRVQIYQGVKYSVSEAHPAADCLPWSLDGEEFASLVQSMREHGFDGERPITVLKDARIIGGRRRELAAKIAGVTPIYTEVDISEADIVVWVIREDLNRRNLTASQRSMAMVELAKLNDRGVNRFTDVNKEKVDSLYDESITMTAKEIAEKAQVGKAIVDQAVKIKKQAPELINSVKEGTLSASAAAKVADLPKPARERVAQAESPKAQAKKEIEKAKEQPEETPEAEAESVDPEKEAAEEFCREVNILCRDIDAIVKRVKEIKATPFAINFHLDSATQQIEAARSSIFSGRPTHKCPYCDNTGKIRKDCRCCAGTGWTNKGDYKSGSAAMGGKK